jgi:hypothetical protein
LAVVVKAEGQPRMVREAACEVLKWRQTMPGAYGVVVAPFIAAGGAAVCREEGIGYVDMSGNCRLCFGKIYVEREGKPGPSRKRRDLRSLYSARATRVLRVLLASPRKRWKIVELAREAGVSVGHVSNVKRRLGDREWLSPGLGGIALGEPGELLAEWGRNYDHRRNGAADYYSMRDPREIEKALADVCGSLRLRYALTSFSAAARWAPAVRYQRVFALVEGGTEDVALRAELKRVPSGPNVTLLSPYDDGVFYGSEERRRVRIASPVQAYLDLVGLGGRGDEAAREILDRVIRPGW